MLPPGGPPNRQLHKIVKCIASGDTQRLDRRTVVLCEVQEQTVQMNVRRMDEFEHRDYSTSPVFP